MTTRTGRSVSLAALATAYAGVVFIWSAANLLPRSPVLGFALVVSALIYLAVLARLATGLIRTRTTPGPRDNRGAALYVSLSEYTTRVVRLTVLGVLVAVFALVVWGVSHSAG